MKTLLPEINSADKRFHNGNPATGEQGTRVTDTWLNDVQDSVRDVQAEAHYVLQKAGFKPKPETQTQLYQAIVKIIGDNRRSASTTTKGEVQLTSDYSGDSEVLGLTQKAGKALKALIDSLTRNLSNYIPNSKKSNATNSASGDTVATSAAVKSANDNANGRVSKSGDTMTGDLSIKSGEYSKLKLYNASGKEFRFESTPDTHESLGKVSYRSADGATEYYAQFFPKKSGTFALTNEVLLNSGIQSIHGFLIAENVGSAWANYQWGAKQGKWRLEVHPDSHTAGNRRFNMVWSPNSGNPTYLSFPHIGDNGETVAYQSWIGQNYVKKSGDTMTGNLTINNGEPRLHGKRGGNNSWYVGLPNGTSDSLYLHSYASNTSLSLESDKINTTKPVFSAGNRTAVSLNGHNIQFRWNNNGNLDLKVDNTELGNIHYTKKAYVYTTAENYGGIIIDRASKNDRMMLESNGNKFAFIRRNLQTGSNHYAISTPEKSGTMALVEDFTNPTFTLTNWANNGSSLNNITGTNFLSFGDEAIRGLGLPTGADWVGIQIADQGLQKTQIISGGYNNHYIRSNDDLSKSNWANERLLTDADISHATNGSNKAKIASEFALGELSRNLRKEKLIWSGSSTQSITVNVGVTSGILLILLRTRGRQMWHCISIEHCNNTVIGFTEYGGENADKDYSNTALVTRNGSNITIGASRWAEVNKVILLGA